MNTNFLSISWSTSRGRDTYGYNICRLDSSNTGRRYRCSGGGYDMIGTVVADWLRAEHQSRLAAVHDRRASEHGTSGYETLPWPRHRLYGLHFNRNNETYSVDGACGVESVRAIAEAVGISMSSVVNRRGHVTGYMVTDYGSADAMRDAWKDAASQGEAA